MRIDNSFTVGLPVEDAWKVLLDVGRIAPCIPGAELPGVAGDDYRGVIDVTLGAVTAQYEGAVRITDVDEVTGRVVLRGEGRETGGQGSASATVTATLRAAGGDRTEVALETDISIGGTIAELGPGVMADALSSLLDDFARCLERDLLSGSAPAPAATAGATVTPAEIVADEVGDLAVEDPERAAQFVEAVAPKVRSVETEPAEPVGLPTAAGGSVADRALPAAIVGVLLMQILPKGRIKRLGLAVLGSALVAGLVAGKQQQKR